MTTPAPAPAGDPVFAAFCAAGLWPGLGRGRAAELPGAGIVGADDVTADRLIKMPRVGRQRAERLFSGFLSAQPIYEVVEMLVGAGLEAKLAAGVADTLGPDAARRLTRRPVGAARADRASRCATPTGWPSPCCPASTGRTARRGRAIVGLTLRTATRDGHTVLPADLVVAALHAEGVADPAAAVVAAVESGDVLEHEPPEPEDPEPSPTRRCGRSRWPATAWPRRWSPRRSPGWPPPPSGSPTPRRCARVAKGLDKAQTGGRRPGAGRRRQPAHRRPGHRQEPHGRGRS